MERLVFPRRWVPPLRIAGESKEIIEFLEVRETDFSEKVGASVAAATAGEHKGIHGLLEVDESEFSSKSGSAAVAATVCAEAADQAGVLHGTSSLFLNSRIHPHGHRSRIHGSSHFPHARARAVAAAALLAGAASRSAACCFHSCTVFTFVCCSCC